MQLNHQRPTARHHALVYLLGPQQSLDSSLPEVLRQHLMAGLERHEMVTTPTHGLLPQRWLLAARCPDGAVALRRRGGAIAKSLQAVDAHRLWVAPLPSHPAAPPTMDQMRWFLEGFIQGSYRFDRYQRPPKKAAVAKAPTDWQVSCADRLPKSLSENLQHYATVDQLGRDLINTPARDMGPSQFVAAARSACAGTAIKISVWDVKRLQRERCDCILSVGAASGVGREPRLLILDYPGSSKGHLALCGKGVCFDSGGLQIKPGNAMQLMRKDMGGAATVLAAVIAHAQSGAKQGVRAYIPLVENAISGEAFRPGDVLTAADGTTIEVGHTDAEGRLVLADALSVAARAKPQALLTVATLTGAALVALGRIHVPLMATDDALADRLLDAAAGAGEKMWRLPLDEDHRALVRSKLAMLTNSGGPDAACITAGAFLAHFAGDVPFAHCDISPASWREAAHDLGPAGATGVLVSTLARYLAGSAR